jgi:hypothetical protein
LEFLSLSMQFSLSGTRLRDYTIKPPLSRAHQAAR